MTPRPLFPSAHHLRIWYFQTQPDGNSRLRCSVPCPCSILKPFLHLKLATTCQKHKEKRALNGQSHPDSQVKTIFIIQSVPAHKGSVSKGKTSLNIEQNISKCSAILSDIANPMLLVAPRSSLAKSFMMSSHRPHSLRLAAWLSCAGSHIVGWERLRMRGSTLVSLMIFLSNLPPKQYSVLSASFSCWKLSAAERQSEAAKQAHGKSIIWFDVEKWQSDSTSLP